MAGPVARSCWCGSRAAHSIGEFNLHGDQRFPLVQCDGCGVQALEPQPSDDMLLAHYSAEYYGATREKFIWPFSTFVQWFQNSRARQTARLVSSSARILDVGCGNGGFLIQMKQRGYEVQGTEWTQASAERVPAQEGIPIHVGDLLELDLPEHSYDLITMWHVLEHVRRPFDVLKKIRTLLKPTGRVMLALPNAQSGQAARFGLAWLHYDPPRHLFDFGVDSVKRLLHATDFELEWLTTGSLEQDAFGYIQSWLNQRGYPRDRLYSMLKGLQPSSQKRRIDLIWLMILIGPALLKSLMDSWRSNAATMTLVAGPRSELSVDARLH